MTENLRPKRMIKSRVQVTEFQNTQRIGGFRFTIYDKRPEEIREALIKIFGDDVTSKKMRKEANKNNAC